MRFLILLLFIFSLMHTRPTEAPSETIDNALLQDSSSAPLLVDDAEVPQCSTSTCSTDSTSEAFSSVAPIIFPDDLDKWENVILRGKKIHPLLRDRKLRLKKNISDSITFKLTRHEVGVFLFPFGITTHNRTFVMKTTGPVLWLFSKCGSIEAVWSDKIAVRHLPMNHHLAIQCGEDRLKLLAIPWEDVSGLLAIGIANKLLLHATLVVLVVFSIAIVIEIYIQRKDYERYRKLDEIRQILKVHFGSLPNDQLEPITVFDEEENVPGISNRQPYDGQPVTPVGELSKEPQEFLRKNEKNKTKMHKMKIEKVQKKNKKARCFTK